MDIVVWPDGEYQEATDPLPTYKSDDFERLEVLDPILEVDGLLEIAIEVHTHGKKLSREEILTIPYRDYEAICFQILAWQNPTVWNELTPEDYPGFWSSQRLALREPYSAIARFIKHME